MTTFFAGTDFLARTGFDFTATGADFFTGFFTVCFAGAFLVAINYFAIFL